MNSMKEDTLKWIMKICVSILETIDSEISNSLLQNEQFVLDFYDKVNEISVRK